MIRHFKRMIFNWFFARINDVFWRLFINLFGISFSLVCGIIAGVSLLGFLSIYQSAIGIIVSLIISILVYYWFSARVETALLKIIHTNSKLRFPTWLESLLIISALLIVGLLILMPVARWPTSYSGDWFVWDAGAYHFPKAIELYKSGSVWDLSIPYGEYPFGYESLLTFALSINGNESMFGFIHVIIILLFFSSAAIIAKQLTNISPGLILLLMSLMILSDNFFQTFNLWRIFTQDIYTIGKNDLFLSTAQLSLIVFALIPYKKKIDDWILIGCSLASMISLSIKPNSIFLVIPLLLMKIFDYINKERDQKGPQTHFWMNKEVWKTILIVFVLIIPGVLWSLRNLLSMGRLFSDEVMQLSAWSIAANIANPNFYNYIPTNLIILTGILITGIIGSYFWRKDLRLATFIYLLLFLAFISTPVSGFFKRTDVPTLVNWRFAETLLAFAFIYLLAWIARPWDSMLKIFRHSTWMQTGFSIFVVIISGWLLFTQADKMQWKPENEIILHDQFIEPVGTDGYRSAYDFIQQNIRDSVIWVENGLPYYVYGPGFTNSITRKTSPDYLLIIHTDWFGEGRFWMPSYLNETKLKQRFELIYQDGQGSVYQSNR